MKLSNLFLLGSCGITQGQDMGGSLGLQFDTVWPVLMNMAKIPKDALFWPYLLCGQKMCPMMLYSMIKDNDKDVNLKKNFLPMISLLGMGTDGEVNRADMLYKLIPYILPKDDSQQEFGSLLSDPLLMAEFLSAPGMTRQPYFDEMTGQWVQPTGPDQNQLLQMLMMQLLQSKDTTQAADSVLAENGLPPLGEPAETGLPPIPDGANSGEVGSIPQMAPEMKNSDLNQFSPRAFMTDEEYMISQIILSEAENASKNETSDAPQVLLKSSSAKKNSNKKKKMRNSKKDAPK